MEELAALDREAFAQVWSRVAPGGEGPVEVIAPQVEPPAQSPQEQGTPARELQGLILACLSDASVYRDLNRRIHSGGARQTGGRPGEAKLTDLKNRKVRQAKRLSAAYFLLSGVRYWPESATPVNPPEPFFPALRQRFLAEGRRAGELEELAATAADADLKELYTDLARETREMTRTIRVIVENET